MGGRRDPDEEKIEAFIRKRGVTACPPLSVREYAPARAMRDDSGGNWLHRRVEESMSPERRLAQAKLSLMLGDLGGRGLCFNTPTERAAGKTKAHHWFFGPTDFTWWCEAAGFDPEYVRGKAAQVYEHGCPQRIAAPGTGKRYEERKRYREKREAMGYRYNKR